MVEAVATGAITPTMRKFGAPDSTLRDYDRWSVLRRPQQITLGSMVLIARETATAWPMLSAAAFTELKVVTADLEHALKQAFDYDKINYLMLMMVDPDVHFHVIPRYGTVRGFAGQEFTDRAWPGPPRLDLANQTTDAINAALSAELIRCWPK